ncbi:hypothetical protein SAMD00023353_4001050 [Rosellinia necatrix]|uniref:Uncharacterized protein n=1 Tax=Rosellinia necatrix TaxID=77044 RepID=A0A1S8A9P8_ROSNE|nr:hypothetical protein SAMD00023353_4001050 [Rosellinia necatrix]
MFLLVWTQEIDMVEELLKSRPNLDIGDIAGSGQSAMSVAVSTKFKRNMQIEAGCKIY